MNENGDRIAGPEWGRGKRLATGLNVSASVILAVVVVAMVNYLSYRFFHFRTDVSQSHFYSLSDKTRNMLSSLKADIAVFVVFRSTTADDEEILRDTRNLLKEYRYFVEQAGSFSFRIERVDPERDPTRAEALRQRYNLQGADVVIFDAGGRSKCVPKRLIVDYAYEASLSGIRAKKVAFNGEQIFSSVILSITQEKKPVVYFVEGHGEHAVSDFAKFVGYSELARTVRLDNIDVRSISLVDQQGIPGDCDVLVIAGPKEPFHESEVACIGAYLSAGRNLFLLVDSGQSTGLEALAREWGVGLPNARVVEKTLSLRVGDDRVVSLPGTGEELYVRRYGDHPITAKLRDVSMILCLPRPVVPVAVSDPALRKHADIPQVTVLAFGSETGWAETDPDQEPPRYDRDIDQSGPVPVAVAVERGPVGGVNVELRPTRIVVIGDSDFAANDRVTGSNEDFFMSALNWLLERETLMAIGPKAYEKMRLKMNESQVRSMFLTVVVGLPVVVAIFGFAVWFKRAR